jgi:hypothetical protein
MKEFVTTDIDISAYLLTVGWKLSETRQQGRFVQFVFPEAAAADVTKFLGGAAAPAHSILENYREIRNIIIALGRQNKHANYSRSY